MPRLLPKLTLCFSVIALCLSFALSTTNACPFCTAPSLTLSEQMDQADAILKVKWHSAEKATAESAGTSTFEIVKIVKAPEGTLKVGDKIELPAYRSGKTDQTFLLTGTQSATLEWASPLDVSEEAFKYITQAPAPSLPYQQRLPYYIKYLENSDELIANDAYGEFANAPYEEIAAVADKIDSEKVRKWVVDPKTVPTRMGLYGLLLGLAGNEQDIEAMREHINKETKDFRLGIDGIMSGYLMLAGEKGLDEIDQSKLKNKDVTFSETYAAMQALRFMWKYEPTRIPQDRLKESMRILLGRPELADLVIADLSRWEDWEVADQLIGMYDSEDYSIPSIKRAIIRYLLVCAASDTSEGDAEPPRHVLVASQALDRIEEQDPKIYRDAKRFFRLR